MIIPACVINNNNKCVHYNKVPITGFKLNIVTGATSARIKFLESFIGRKSDRLHALFCHYKK